MLQTAANRLRSWGSVAGLTRIQEAAAENKNRRAAAWILERRHPEEYG